MEEARVHSETITVTLDDLKAILQAGEILASALSQEEMEQFSGHRCAPLSPVEYLSRSTNGSSLSQYVPNSILDAEHRETDHKEDDR